MIKIKKREDYLDFFEINRDFMQFEK